MKQWFPVVLHGYAKEPQVNNTYLVDPTLVKFNPKYIGFNQKKPADQYEALKTDIKNRGQDRPVIMKDGYCYDGWHRCQVAIDLGTQLLCMDVNSNISEKDLLMLCNVDTFTGRNYTTSQKAVAAYQMVKNFRYSDSEANRAIGLNPRDKGIVYARTIAASEYGKKHDILAKLMAGEAVSINGARTKSIDTARRLIKKLEEFENEYMQDQLNQLAKTEIEIDYNALIDNETLREMFWNWTKMDTVASKIEMIRILHVALNVPTPKQIQESK